jgi:hypothetical protein
MPKDPTKNVDRYKIRGGHLNEFQYTQNQEDFAEAKPKTLKATKSAKPNPTKGASAKKLAARKAAKK